jgi:hypothetical protein
MAEFWEESQCIPTFSIKKICNFFLEKCLFELGRICQILLWEMKNRIQAKKEKNHSCSFMWQECECFFM